MNVLRPLLAVSSAVLCLLAMFGPARAELPAELCERAALQVAAETGVPPDILATLTLTETGRRRGGLVRPWAWSVNAEGRGIWFDDMNEAIRFAEDRVAQRRLNVDIGCFQLNYRWHGQHFASPAEMFDPLANARYAARFVRDLYTEFGDWRRAAGAFHSRTPAHATRYLARFDDLRAGYRQRGFEGMTGGPETYNSFAALAGTLQIGDPLSPAAPTRNARRSRTPPDIRLTLLGAPPGGTGSGGSLAVLGAPRGPAAPPRTGGLFAPRAGPLIGG
ncbi:MAG: hypothetical protein Q4F71_08020 [Paracoccus sp. (in: a-proteobacteria)]|nr:hypothetical protein [Paracoccus sp. (in: a-proteobacteria)]